MLYLCRYLERSIAELVVCQIIVLFQYRFYPQTNPSRSRDSHAKFPAHSLRRRTRLQEQQAPAWFPHHCAELDAVAICRSCKCAAIRAAARQVRHNRGRIARMKMQDDETRPMPSLHQRASRDENTVSCHDVMAVSIECLDPALIERDMASTPPKSASPVDCAVGCSRTAKLTWIQSENAKRGSAVQLAHSARKTKEAGPSFRRMGLVAKRIAAVHQSSLFGIPNRGTWQCSSSSSSSICNHGRTRQL